MLKSERTTAIAQIKRFYLLICLLTLTTWPAGAQAQEINSRPKTPAPQSQPLRLSPEGVQVADQIGITLLLDQLSSNRVADSPVTLESLLARQQITEKVLAASLDVDGVNAIIDAEVEQIRSIRSDLQSRRDKAQNLFNVASLITGGALGVVNTALQFSSSTANLGNAIGVGGGAASVVLSIVGIHKQGGGRRVLGDSPRMLARFFGRQPPAPESIRSNYPEAVWSYLNSVPPSQPNKGTRREQLIAKWQNEGRIPTVGSTARERRIDFLSGSLSQARRLNIDELSGRIAMLNDVRATVSLMKLELSEILRGLNAGGR